MSKDIILGIDPGYDRMGWAILEKGRGDFKVLDYGCVQTSPKQSLAERLEKVSDGLERIIKKFNPTAVGVEELFFFKNAKTAIKVGEARGAILLTIQKNNLKIFEFTPLQIKQQIVGNGRADKIQVQKMIALILGLKIKRIQDDAADALAVAYCAAQDLGFRAKIE